MSISRFMDNKMTKKVGLVLISSSLILNGCSHHVPQQDPAQEGQPQVVQPVGGGIQPWWYFHHSGGYVGGGYSGGFHPGTTSHGGGIVSSSGVRSGGGSFKASPSVSARGGFGASGHAFGGSGA